jgi:predicted TIM-barrel fold metal-dependent hydrolase
MTVPLDTPAIDAHHHFWDPVAHYYPWLCDAERPPHRYGDHASICRPYLPEDYRRDTSVFELAGSVFMEADWDPRDPIGEMRYIQQLRKQSGLPTVAVGQAWLHQADAAHTLEQLATFDFVRGIRQKPRANDSPGDAQPGGMMDSEWRGGYALLERHGLHFELQTPWWHLHEAQQLARDFPATAIVVNHAGMPPSDRGAEGMARWRQAMAGVAQCPNVFVKISGIGQAGRRWSREANRPVVRETIELFGADRCMFGSNYPVDSLCASFEDIFRGFADIVADLSAPDRRKLFHDNALRIYRMDAGSSPA